MPDDEEPNSHFRHSRQVKGLPDDVSQWLDKTLEPDETVASCLLSDILHSGEFGERWTFLTSRRLMVLSPNGKPDEADIEFELPIDEIEDSRVQEYVGSGALLVQGRDRGHEVARFSLTSHQEANDISYCLNQIAEARKEGRQADLSEVAPPKRGLHRCSKCGGALRRAGEVCHNCIDRRQIVWRLFAYVWPYRWFALLGLGLTMAVTGLQLTPPYLTKVLVDDVIGPGNLPLLKVVIGLLAGAFVLRALLGVFRGYVMQWLGQRVLLDLRVRVFDHLQLLPLSYYNQRQTGSIMSRVTGDLSRLQFFIAEGFQDLLINVATLFLIAVILLLLNWKLFIFALAPLPIIGIGTYLFGRKVHLIYHRIWRRMAHTSAILTDTIPGIRVVKSFAQERRESDRFSRTVLDLFHQQMRAVRLSTAFFPALGFMTGLGTIFIFGVGGYMVVQGQTTLGVLVAFTGYLGRFYQPVQRFGRLNHRLQHCMTSAERVFEILDNDVEPLERDDGIKPDHLRGEVEFKDVRFAYDPGKYALDGVSFRVEPGEMIGLVGPSGAGKSTLVHLIARFYEVDEGEILIDGHPLDDLNLRWFREQIGVVLQDPYLFHGTVWQNIAYSQIDASADEIIAAAQAANAHEFICSLPDGYDTVIGERGQTLSGGERQRVSIARAVLRDPQILILDEATASVDTETELLIQTALERLVVNRTTFAIAHRLSTLRRANRLMVLERGKLVEVGTHEELLEEKGLYHRLVDIQSELSKMKAW